jgi:hypothetical protein
MLWVLMGDAIWLILDFAWGDLGGLLLTILRWLLFSLP